MQTWLDWFIYHQAHVFHEQNLGASSNPLVSIIERNLKKDGFSIKEKNIPDYNLGKAIVLAIAKDLAGVLDAGDGSEDQPSKNMAALYLMAGQFIEPNLWGDKIKAIKLTEDLIETFQDAKAPEIKSSELGVLPASFTYIDLPVGKIILKDKLSLKALTVIGAINPGNEIIQCILSDGRGFSDQHIITFPLVGDFIRYSLPEPFMAKYSADELSELLDVITERVRSFTILTLLYYRVASNEETHLLPRLSEKTLRNSSIKKQKAKQKTHTLFSVHLLSPPPDRFGRNKETISAGKNWELTHKVSVHPHFRWQACGPKWSERKLLWIEKFERGPTGSRKKMNLDVMS